MRPREKESPKKGSQRGSIRGVEVGQSYGNREAMRVAGVHRATQGGIYGADKAGGALSIFCSGGYAGNEDIGDTLVFSGQGQEGDQTLTRFNLALAMTMEEKPDPAGNTALVWTNSKAIRVVRNADKHNKFAPDVGCRYDGLYKLSRYTYEDGPDGYKIYRFYLHRADGVPGPWTEEGKARIRKLELKMVSSILRQKRMHSKSSTLEANTEKESVEKELFQKTTTEKDIINSNTVEMEADEEFVKASAKPPRVGALRPRPAGAIIGGRL